MIVDWTDEFERMLEGLESKAASGDDAAQRVVELIDAQLEILTELDAEPVEESPTIMRVRQFKKYPIWRISHPYEKGIAVRTIAWFDGDQVVVALFANDKASMGDVFYDGVGVRADRAIDEYVRVNRRGDTHGD